MKRLYNIFYVGALALAGLACSPVSMHACNDTVHSRLENLETRVSWLEGHKVTYGPITVSEVVFNKEVRNNFVAMPGQRVEGALHYKLDSSQQEFLTKNHLIVGIAGVAAETCVTTLYGVRDSSGTAKFNLTMPLEEGDYEVRIAYIQAPSCEEAINSWNVLGNEPTNFATIGFIKVVNP